MNINAMKNFAVVILIVLNISLLIKTIAKEYNVLIAANYMFIANKTIHVVKTAVIPIIRIF